MLEIKPREDKNIEIENNLNSNSKDLENDWVNYDFTTKTQLDIDGEIKSIKNHLQKAMNALETLEFKVLKFKNNNNFNEIIVRDELEELRRQLRGD